MTTRRAVLSAGVALIAGGRSMTAQAATPYPRIGQIRHLSPEMGEIFAADAVIEQLADGMTWSEGPVWIADGGYLLFSDVPGNVMHRWSAVDGKTVFLKPSGYAGPPTQAFREPGSNGMTLSPAGELLVCDHGNRAVVKVDLKTRAKTVVADRFQGKRFNSPNDLIVARQGALKDTIYFTDPPYGLEGLNASPIKELAFNGVYLRRPSGDIVLVDDQLTFPNGLALSPDERRLYVAVSDPEGPVIMAYDLDAQGLPTHRQVFFDATALLKAGGPGLPDGMRVDAKGRLFATGPGGVLVISPEAKLLGVIETGFPIANCTFGEDGHTLFLTSNHLLARVRTKTLPAYR